MNIFNMAKSDVLRQFWVKDQDNIILLTDLITSLLAERQLSELDALLQGLPSASATLPFIFLTKMQLKLLLQDWHGFDVLVSSCRNSLHSDPSFSQLVAQKHFFMREFQESFETLKPFITSSESHLALAARSLYMQGEIHQALTLIDDFRQNFQVAESGTSGLYALMLADSGLSEVAQQWATQTLEVDPDQADALVARSYLLIDSQQYEQAAVFVRQGLEVAPGIGRLWSMHGQILMVSEQISDALIAFDQATILMPEHVGTWLLKGWCHWISGDYQTSEQSFLQALSLDRNFADSHGALAVVQLQLGDRAAAELSLAKARRLDRESFSVAFADSLLLEIDGSADLAAEKIRQKLASPHYSGLGSYQDVIAKRLAR